MFIQEYSVYMIAENETAPDFELPGVCRDEKTEYSLSGALSQGRALLLLFYPFDFSPVCTSQLCAMRDAEWFEFTPGIDVWGISGDSTYAHEAFIESYGLNFPLLSDYQSTAARKFDVCYDEWEGHEAVPKRAVAVVAPDRTVQYAWATDQAYEKPDYEPVKAAIDELSELDDSLVPEDIDLDY